MTLFAGIDGGQSSTVAAIGDDRGRILGRGTAGAADEIGVTSDSTRLRDALDGALQDARRRANLSAASTFEAIVAGISGYDGRVYGRAPQLPSERVVLMHDTPIAHAGALGGRAGVIAICGTGSVVYGRAEDGTSTTLGGWGYLFGDEGSAFAIVRDALRVLMRAEDDGDASMGEARDAACEFFETRPLRRIVHALYKGEITRTKVAAFAPAALRFETFRAMAHRGADRVVALIRRAVEGGAPPRVALVGGVFSDSGLREHVIAGVVNAIPGAEIVEPRYEPAYGALLLAYDELGLKIGELHG